MTWCRYEALVVVRTLNALNTSFFHLLSYLEPVKTKGSK